MNRKKVLLLILALQIIILGILALLFGLGILNISVFIFLILTVGLASTVLTVLTVRKFPRS